MRTCAMQEGDKSDILTQTDIEVTGEPGPGNVMKIMPGFRFRQVNFLGPLIHCRQRFQQCA